MSAITYAELQYGVTASADPQRERSNLENLIEDIPVAPFDAPAGIAYGPIRLVTRDSRADHLDKLIAAHAVALGVNIVTNNLRDFAKYPGVVAENWLTPTS
jgi:tRNA(fMet)-specific endonuclease VapC